MQSNNELHLLRPKLKSLLSRVVEAKDSEAFDELYYLLQDQLFRYIVSRLRDRDKSKDVLQDVFVDLWKALQRFSYKSDAQFYGFVFMITKRKIVRAIELEKKNAHISIDEQKHFDTVDENFSLGGDMDTIKNTVESLKEKYRDVLILRYWSHLSFSEIGVLVGAKEDAVRVRHHRALDMLKNLYFESKKHD